MSDPEAPTRGEEGPPPVAYRPDRSPFRRRPQEPLLQRAVPVSARLPGYRPHTARRDLLAGLTVAALALPSGMAYAEVAGLPLVNGLYALLLPTVLYTFLGSCRQLIVGPEGSIATLAAAAVLPLAAAGSGEASELGAMLALLVAACFLLARLVRLGWLADYFSRPVLVGYIHGVAVVLICGQLGKLLGLDIEAREPIGQLVEVLRELGDISSTTLLVGGVALAALLAARFVIPALPAALIVVAASIVVSWAVDLHGRGVAVVGAIPAGLPPVSIPTPPLEDTLKLVPAAIGIFLVGFADGILTARSFAGKHGQHVRANQELLAFSGLSAAAGVTQGFPLGASGSRTAVNDQMGARTQIAGLIAAATIALVLLFFTEPMQYLPKAVLGAVIVSAAVGLVDPAAWGALWIVNRFELGIAAATTVGVIALGVLEALTIAIALSIVDVVRRSAQPHDAVLGWVDRLGRYADVQLHPSARLAPGVVIYRLDDRLFFANARYVKGRVLEAVRGAPEPARWIIFDAEGVTDIDATGLDMLAELKAALARDAITMVVARMKSHIHAQLTAEGLAESIGEDRFFPTVRAAVASCVTPDHPPQTRSQP
ncbi:MAG: SulP family inorganic anion transporter [Solirubrobacteraceae bacterium]